MDAATANEALRGFRDVMQEGLLSVTEEPFIMSGAIGDTTPSQHALVLNSGRPTRLRGALPLLLGVRHVVEVVQAETGARRYRVSTTHYSYRFHLIRDDDEPEVIAFAWDRYAGEGLDHPHLHLGKALTTGSPLLAALPGRFNKLHVPTGRLSLEAVLVFAIREFGVAPTHGRDAGPITAKLLEADARFQATKTRSGWPYY